MEIHLRLGRSGDTRQFSEMGGVYLPLMTLPHSSRPAWVVEGRRSAQIKIETPQNGTGPPPLLDALKKIFYKYNYNFISLVYLRLTYVYGHVSMLVCTRLVCWYAHIDHFSKQGTARESKNVHLWTKHSHDCLAGSSEWHVPPLCLCELIFWIPSTELVALLYNRTWMPCSALETILASIVSCPAPPGRSWCRILLRPAQSFLDGPAGQLHLANWHACPRLVTSGTTGALHCSLSGPIS